MRRTDWVMVVVWAGGLVLSWALVVACVWLFLQITP